MDKKKAENVSSQAMEKMQNQVKKAGETRNTRGLGCAHSILQKEILGAPSKAHIEPVGENPTRAKASHRLGTELDIQGGNKLNEARGRDVSGCNASECIEPRNF